MTVITVYQLNQKFVNRKEDIPEDARQVVYYALAVGHHVGVMDCFTALADIPLEDYRCWLDGLPHSAGRSKLEGALTFGEVEINRSHVGQLMPLLETSDALTYPWIAQLVDGLYGIQLEAAYYLMLRKR